MHAPDGMPRQQGTGRLHRNLGNVSVFRHRLDAVAETLGALQRIAPRHLLNQRELHDQVDQLFEHRLDAEPPPLSLVMCDHATPARSCESASA